MADEDMAGGTGCTSAKYLIILLWITFIGLGRLGALHMSDLDWFALVLLGMIDRGWLGALMSKTTYWFALVFTCQWIGLACYDWQGMVHPSQSRPIDLLWFSLVWLAMIGRGWGLGALISKSANQSALVFTCQWIGLAWYDWQDEESSLRAGCTHLKVGQLVWFTLVFTCQARGC